MNFKLLEFANTDIDCCLIKTLTSWMDKVWVNIFYSALVNGKKKNSGLKKLFCGFINCTSLLIKPDLLIKKMITLYKHLSFSNE